jgi:HPr kinase/phosphorylase
MMMALGATLVSDDQTKLTVQSETGDIIASAPASIQDMIEARGIGVLSAQTLDQCVIRAIVDLDVVEQERLPLVRKRRLLGCDIPLYHRSEGPYFAAALIQLLKGGRCA